MYADNSDHTEDALLFRQIENGNKNSFDLLYGKYWERAYTEVYKRLKDHDQSKDIVQEIFAHIWIKRETLHIENLPAYLNVAIRNRVFKLVAKQKLTHCFLDRLEEMPSAYHQADNGLLWKEFFRSYEALLTTLPPQRQIIFRLRFQHDLPTRDIAAQLGLSRKTVQNQLGKAIEKLRISILRPPALVIIFLLFPF
jgi:RNA polymerase sigma-70 factor (ECF subfamily)